MTSTLIVLDFETTGMSPRLGARLTWVAAELAKISVYVLAIPDFVIQIIFYDG